MEVSAASGCTAGLRRLLLSDPAWPILSVLHRFTLLHVHMCGEYDDPPLFFTSHTLPYAHNNHHRRSLADRRWAFWRKRRRRFLLAKKMEAPWEALTSNSLSRCIDELRRASNREIRRIIRLLEVTIQGFWYLNVMTIALRVLVATVCCSEGHTSISVQANALIPGVIWHCDLQFIKVVISRAVPMLRYTCLNLDTLQCWW